MKHFLIFLLVCSISEAAAFDCSQPGSVYGNPSDYRSYYLCDDQCPLLKYCQSPQLYFSNDTKSCVIEPNNWIPRYYLSGTAPALGYLTGTLYFLQDGYQLLWTYDDAFTSETFTGRYVNETYVQGVHVRRVLTTNCINLFDVDIIATADRNFCATHRLHPQSALCDLYYPYELTYCRILSI